MIVDPRPVRDESGNAVMKLTPAMIEELFDEFPVLRRAYDENVPKPVSLSPRTLSCNASCGYHTLILALRCRVLEAVLAIKAGQSQQSLSPRGCF